MSGDKLSNVTKIVQALVVLFCAVCIAAFLRNCANDGDLGEWKRRAIEAESAVKLLEEEKKKREEDAKMEKDIADDKKVINDSAAKDTEEVNEATRRRIEERRRRIEELEKAQAESNKLKSSPAAPVLKSVQAKVPVITQTESEDVLLIEYEELILGNDQINKSSER